jgi:hypothetical protein
MTSTGKARPGRWGLRARRATKGIQDKPVTELWAVINSDAAVAR